MNTELFKLLLDVAIGGSDSPFKIGQTYCIRTVTYTWTGRTISITNQEIELTEACCIFDSGRFSEFAKGVFDNNSEFEAIESNPIIGRGSIVDAFPFPSDKLPRKTK